MKNTKPKSQIEKKLGADQRPSTMALILATHVDENVNLMLRYDKAANPDGSMMILDGILQAHPVVANAFIMVVPPKDGRPAMTYELAADDVVAPISKAPAGLIEVLIARAQAQAAKDDQDAKRMSEAALAEMQPEPVIHKP